ncbi:MAG: 4Fe-4S binding protein [Oscillospiraceae bacterium]
MAKNKNRWKIQAFATVLTNSHIVGFFSGKIFKGNLKAVCVPGLNCYSCPGAAGSCPIGSLQAVIGSSKFQFSYYIVGIMILFGVLFGRLVCGFLCPFGWFQELLHKIPTKKFSTKKVHLLTYLKYVILGLFVIVLPMTLMNEVGMGDPWFCKWLCPAGILEGAIPLALFDSGIRAALGALFAWKSCLLLGIVTLSLFFYRPFCKWLCPLGAFYALFNKLSFYRFHIDKEKCTSCGACARACKMDVEVYKTPNSPECIRCGDCISSCPKGAICKSINIKKKKVEIIEKTN